MEKLKRFKNAFLINKCLYNLNNFYKILVKTFIDSTVTFQLLYTIGSKKISRTFFKTKFVLKGFLKLLLFLMFKLVKKTLCCICMYCISMPFWKSFMNSNKLITCSQI